MTLTFRYGLLVKLGIALWMIVKHFLLQIDDPQSKAAYLDLLLQHFAGLFIFMIICSVSTLRGNPEPRVR